MKKGDLICIGGSSMKLGDLVCISELGKNSRVFSVTKRRTIIVFHNEICIFLKRLDFSIGTYYHMFHIRTQNIIEVQYKKVEKL